jgi:hypothetical protein
LLKAGSFWAGTVAGEMHRVWQEGNRVSEDCDSACQWAGAFLRYRTLTRLQS